MKPPTKRFVFLPGILFLLTFQPEFTHAQWMKLTHALPYPFSGEAIDASAPGKAVVLCYNAVYKTSDAGATWESSTLPAKVSPNDVSMTDADHIWFSGRFGHIYATADGGKNWMLQFYDTTLTRFMNYVEMFDLKNGVAMGDSRNAFGPAVVLKTSDGGNHWVSVNDSAFGGYSGDEWRRIDFVDPLVGYFLQSGINPPNLFKTTNGGKTWTALNPFFGYAQVIKFYDSKIGLAIWKKGELMRTIDGGATWVLLSSPHTEWGNDIEFSPADPAKIWLADSFSLYFSSDTGRTWTAQLPNAGGHCTDIKFLDSDNGWFLTSDAVYRTVNGGKTFVKKERPDPLCTFSPMQNFPNPFNASTVILFDIPGNGRVAMEIFDTQGRKIRRLMDGTQPPGRHAVIWDGKDDRGKSVESGMYICSMQTQQGVKTIKTILLK